MKILYHCDFHTFLYYFITSYNFDNFYNNFFPHNLDNNKLLLNIQNKVSYLIY